MVDLPTGNEYDLLVIFVAIHGLSFGGHPLAPQIRPKVLWGWLARAEAGEEPYARWTANFVADVESKRVEIAAYLTERQP